MKAGDRLVADTKVYVGHNIKLIHRFKGLISGHLLNYENATLIIQEKDSVNHTYVNKGLVKKVISNT